MTDTKSTWIPKTLVASDIGRLVSIIAPGGENHMGILESFSVSKKDVTYRFQGGFSFSRPADFYADTYVIHTSQKGVNND